MFATLRNRFGIPGVISVIALVFAMLGGAYAASNSGDGKGATASAKKSAKGPRGPKGPKGATGEAGPAGPAGPAGAKGDTGAAGANGANGEKGATGADGVSVTAAAASPAQCNNGGTKFTSASGTSFVCNGANGLPGTPGPKGDPWTAGGTLPSGATETGTWAISTSSVDEYTGLDPSGHVATSISFPIPLAAPIAEANTHYVSGAVEDPVPSECENASHAGAASAANPEASSGHLCVYAGQFTTSANLSFAMFLAPDAASADTGVSGVVMLFGIADSNPALGEGSWAVTG